jgi:hypothetical protein
VTDIIEELPPDDAPEATAEANLGEHDEALLTDETGLGFEVDDVIGDLPTLEVSDDSQQQ